MPASAKVAEIRLDFYKPDGTLATSVTNDVRRMDIAEVADEAADEATFLITNYLSEYTGLLEPNQEVRVFVKLQGEGSLSHIWTGLVDSVEPIKLTPTLSALKLHSLDFVFGILQNAEVSYAYTAKDAALAVADLCLNYAPEIDTSQLTAVGRNVSISGTGQKLDEAIKEIARRSDCTLTSDKDKKLYLKPRGGTSSGVTVTYAKVAAGSLKVVKHRPEANVVRVWGGDSEVAGDANDPASKNLVVVTNTSRQTFKFNSPKSRVTKIEIWTDPGSYTDDLIVRIQADKNNAPKDATNVNFDLASKTLSKEFLAVGGYTSFLMPDHALGAGISYWGIVETASTGGQRIGVSAADSSVAYKVHHPTPVIVERSDEPSIQQFRRIVKTVRRKNVTSQAEAIEIADSELARTKNARWDVTYEPIDATLREVPLGQTVTLSLAGESLSGAFSLVRRRRVYDGDGSLYGATHGLTLYDPAPSILEAMARLAQEVRRVSDGLLGPNKSYLTDLFRSFTDTILSSDTVTATEQATGTFLVDTAQVGFSDVD